MFFFPPRLFGFVARKQGSTTDNVSHLFAELDPDQPASAIAGFVSRMTKRWTPPPVPSPGLFLPFPVVFPFFFSSFFFFPGLRASEEDSPGRHRMCGVELQTWDERGGSAWRRPKGQRAKCNRGRTRTVQGGFWGPPSWVSCFCLFVFRRLIYQSARMT